MIEIAKLASVATKVLAALWIGLLLLGLLSKFAFLVAERGWLAAPFAWARWFDPTNPLNLVIHLIELSPALLLFWISNKCRAWADARNRA